MKPCLILLFTLPCFCTNPLEASPPAGAKIAWDIRPATATIPKGSLYLAVNGKSIPVARNPEAAYQALLPSEFADYSIPKGAILAAYSWHAGFGDVVYVTRKGDTFEVFRREMDESETSTFPSRKILTIRLE